MSDTSESRPNVLFMIADDHRFDALGVAGDPMVKTPTLDGLAAGGTRFTHAHTMGGLSGAVCIPSRTAVLSGCNPIRASVEAPEGQLPSGHTIRSNRPLWPERLRQAGYQAHGIGKWHNDGASFNRCFESGEAIFMGGMGDQFAIPVQDYDPTGRYGSDRARPSGEHATDVFCDAAVGFLEDRDPDRPFCLYLAFTSPHDPRDATEPFASMYDPDAVELPKNFMREHPFDNGELEIRDELLAGMPRTEAEVRRHIADYYAMISHMDAAMGRVLEQLETLGLADDTIVVYTSDHGLAVGRHGLMGKQNLYDHSIRIPWLMRGPGIPAGEAREALAMSFDFFPTLLELCGEAAPADLEGRSLGPVLRDESMQVRSTAFSMYKNLHRGVSDGRWKLIRYFRSGETGENRWQLFNLASDPWELDDLAGNPAHAEHARRLADELVRWQESIDDFLPTDTVDFVTATA